MADINRVSAVPKPENRQVSDHTNGLEETACKTVGPAYVGSNPTPATTSGNSL